MLDPTPSHPSPPSQAKGLGYFPAIDGLRALAVLAVIVFHLNNAWLPGGFVGVDIFFVISGFVVTASVAHLKFDSLWKFQSYFYARRIVRIFPALAVCLVATSLASALFVPKAWLSDDIAKVGFAAVFGTSNISLALNSDSYFSPRSTFNPFTHTWSLGVEEQFYLLFPLIIYLFGGGEGRWRSRKSLIAVVALLCGASVAVSAVLTRQNWQQAFYMLPSRYWELGAGMLLCLTLDKWRGWLAGSSVAGWTAGLGAVSLIVASLLIPSGDDFPFPLAVLPVLGAAGLIALAVARPGDLMVRPFSTRPSVFVGRISYSLYLWHWPVLVLMKWTVGLESWPAYLAAVLCAFGLALLSYYGVEAPLRRFRRLKGSRSGPIVAGGVVAILVVAAATHLVFRQQSQLTLSRTRDVAAWYPDPDRQRALRSDCSLSRQYRSVPGASVQVLTPTGCAAATPGRLAVAGDSHAGAYGRLLANYAVETGRPVLIYSLPGCKFIGLTGPTPAGSACAKFQEAVADELGRTLGPQDVAFLPSLRVPRYGDQWGDADGRPEAPPRRSSPADQALDERQSRDLVQRIGAGGARIVFEAPTPVFKAPPFRCADWFNRRNPICAPGLVVDRAELETRRAPALRGMMALAARSPGVSIWDPFPILCPETECDAFRQGQPLFFDGDHLSGRANDLLLPSFTEAMRRFWPSSPGAGLAGKSPGSAARASGRGERAAADPA